MIAKDIVIEFRLADGNFDRLIALAAELVRLNVDAIVTAGPSVTGPVRQATAIIPIVMTNDNDPSRADSLRAWHGRAGTSPD